MYSTTVDDLRDLGYKVKIFHKRNLNDNGQILAKGGETTAVITDINGNTVTANSRCSTLDGFNKKLGVKIAIGRALNLYHN